MYSVSEANGRGWMLLVTLVVAALIGVEGVSAQEEHDKAVQADEGSESQAVPEEAEQAAADPPAGIDVDDEVTVEETQEPNPQDTPWWVTEDRACDGCPWRRPGHALVQTTFVNVIYGVANLIRGQDTAKVTPVTWWANLKHGWVWDLDDFAVNQIGHPYQGNNYFTSGRGNGLNFWESGAVTAFGSATWEWFGETNKASLNDFINTTLGGIALGEVLHRVAWLVRDTQATGSGRLWREIGATAIDPLTGLNRFLSGDAKRQTGKPPDLVPSGGGALLSAGVLWQGTDTRAIESTGKPFFDIDLFYGDLETGRSRTPYDAFYLGMRVGGGNAISRASIRGRLVGRPLGRTQFMVVQNYDYDENPVYQFGAQSFELKVGVEPQLSKHLSVWLDGGGGLTALAGIDSQPLVEVEIPLLPEEKRGQGVSEGPRTYDYGPGTTFSGTAAFRYDGRTFAMLYYQANHMYVVDGVRANHFLQRMGVDLRLPIRGSLGIGVAGEYFHRQTFFKDPDDTIRTLSAPQVRVFLTWRLS